MRLSKAAHLNRTEAKELAALLREAGYRSVSIARCNDYACNIISFFAGSDVDHQAEVGNLIDATCGVEVTA